ncbi:hypothetical protein MMC34_002795 [Xylographa carneopallida]|nr:hypothetical protein [Xylographa carneopallida]
MRPLTSLRILIYLGPALPPTLAHPSSSSPLHPRVDDPYRALTDCTEGRSRDGIGGNHADWVFQQSFCIRDSDYDNPRHYRKYRIDCRAPNAQSMLEGPVAWYQTAYNIGECTPAQVCVDAPYTPPNPAMMQVPWYKQHGTAYCIEHQHFVHLGQDALHVVGQQGGGAGGAGQAGGGGVGGGVVAG